MQLGESAILIGDRAEHEACDGGVGAFVRERQLVRDAGEHTDRASTRIGTGAEAATLLAAARRVGSGSIAITPVTPAVRSLDVGDGHGSGLLGLRGGAGAGGDAVDEQRERL